MFFILNHLHGFLSHSWQSELFIFCPITFFLERVCFWHVIITGKSQVIFMTNALLVVLSLMFGPFLGWDLDKASTFGGVYWSYFYWLLSICELLVFLRDDSFFHFFVFVLEKNNYNFLSHYINKNKKGLVILIIELRLTYYN